MSKLRVDFWNGGQILTKQNAKAVHAGGEWDKAGSLPPKPFWTEAPSSAPAQHPPPPPIALGRTQAVALAAASNHPRDRGSFVPSRPAVPELEEILFFPR